MWPAVDQLALVGLVGVVVVLNAAAALDEVVLEVAALHLARGPALLAYAVTHAV